MRTWTRPEKATVIGTLVYVFLYVSVMIVRPGSKQFSDTFLDTCQALPAIFGGITGLVYYRQRRDNNRARRIGWLLIALTCLFFSAGHITGTYLKCVQRIEVPFPGLADLFCLIAFLLLLAGMIILFGVMRIAESSRRIFDCAIVTSSIGILSWTLIVQKVWQQSDVPMLDKCIGTVYPLADIAVMFGAVALVWDRQYSRTLRRSLRLLAAGMLGITFYDTSLAWMSLNGNYRAGSWIDATISFGWLLIGYSFLTRIWWSGRANPESDDLRILSVTRVPSLRRMIVPYVAVTTACLFVCIRDYVQDGRLDNSTFVAVAFLMLLVIFRQILALAENRSLTLELKTLNDNLEKMVAERTEKLEVQNRTVLALIEERNRFFRSVSHEVRTPLTSIIGFAEILMEDDEEPLTSRQKAHFQKVIANAHKLLNMVTDLLDISKIEAGRMEIWYNEVELDALVSQVVGNMMPIAREKALEFVISIPDDLPVLTTDEQKLNHILMNLLSNAIKYTVEGTISISAAQSGESISISVEDTGVGIPELELNRVFEEFYRIAGEPTQKGTGLGLTIVSKLTGLLGGRVTVQSREGEGSRFTVTIPIVPVKSGIPNLPTDNTERVKAIN